MRIFVSATQYLSSGKMHLICSPKDFEAVSEVLKKMSNEKEFEVVLMPSSNQLYDEINK